MTRINTNVTSLVAQNSLGRSNSALEQALTRLSTGLRINTGKDDPAGLIASENLRSDISSIRRAISNTDRANQVIATADSALGQVSSLLTDIRGLVTEAANSGALSDDQIEANQLQIDSSLEALNRIAQTTTFQGRRLLDGSLDFITTAGSGFGTVTALKIDQANLGATGQVDVNLSISAAATQALITNSAIPAGQGTGVQATTNLTFTDAATASSGSVSFAAVTAGPTASTGNTTFTVQTAAAVQASTGGGGGSVITLAGGATISIDAIAGEDFDGAAGNLTVTLITDGTVGNNPTVTLNGTTLEIRAQDGTTTAQNIIDALDAFDEGSTVGADLNAALASGAGGTTYANATDAGSNGALTDGADATTDTAQLNITAEAALGAGTTTVNFVFGTPTSGNVSITGTVEGTLTVTLNDDGTAFQLNEIATALAAYTGIDTAVFATNGTLTIDADNDSAPSAASVTGGTNATSSTQTITITGVDGESSNIDITVVESAAVSDGTPVVIGNATDGYTVRVSNSASTTVQAIRAAIEGIAEVATATYAGSATYTPGTNTQLSGAGTGDTLTGGADAVDDVITVTADTAGVAANGITVTITEATAHGNPTAAIVSGNIVVTVDDTDPTTIAQIATAINNLSGYSAEVTETAGDGDYINGTDDSVNGTLMSGEDPGGLDDAIVFEIAGTTGGEVLSFGAGTSRSDIVNAINAVSDATSVTATLVSGVLRLQSSEYGSKAFVAVNVLSGDVNDTFADGLSATRDHGTDIAASINGIEASGDGNTLTINTATLDLTLTVDPGSDTDVSFTITGGGALFQLGPDVVSNQQARIGITSVNTARLGGVNGKLFQLGSGGSADLVSDPNAGARIVEEAIDQITSLRGRLGAFQRTTLETNKNALNDTLVNLSEAESQIRDADFASETAALTRAQILVQSGTVVLQIANQNPQNVLALLQ